MLNRSEVSLTKWDEVITLKIDLRLLEISRLMSLKNSNPNLPTLPKFGQYNGKKTRKQNIPQNNSNWNESRGKSRTLCP